MSVSADDPVIRFVCDAAIKHLNALRVVLFGSRAREPERLGLGPDR